MLVSFIIPCYNSASTIHHCLDSIYALAIPESEFEIIIVDDGSTDETGEIVKEYGRGHDNLKQIRHLVNRNLGAARNTGLAAAKGNYIAFVDSDDEVVSGMAQALNLTKNRGLDMVAMCLEIQEGSSIQTLSLPYSPEQVFTGVQLLEEYPFWSVSVWSYLFAKELIDRVHYPFVEGAYFEDVDFVFKHLFYAERISYCANCGYRFYSNPSSITHTFSPKHTFGFAYLGIRVLSLFNNLSDKRVMFARSLMEYGKTKLDYTFRQLLRLGSFDRVNAFYNLFDSKVNRRSLLRMGDKEAVIKWSFQSRFWLRYRFLTAVLSGIVGTRRVFRFKRGNCRDMTD